MMECVNCGQEYLRPVSSAVIDQMLCRACLRSPATQMRVLLARSRARGVTFERAYHLALNERIRWPHDTTHRKEWKATLGYVEEDSSPLEQARAARQIALWRAAYYREPMDDRRAAAAAAVFADVA